MRYFLLVLTFFTSGALALFYLIAAHVDGVVVAHTEGLVDHLSHMLDDSQSVSHMLEGHPHSGHTDHGLEHILHSSDVFKIALFDARGVLVEETTEVQLEPMTEFVNLTLRELEAIAAGHQPAIVVRNTQTSDSWPEDFAKAVRFVHGSDGTVAGFVKFFVDVTALRRAYLGGLWWLASLTALFGVLLFAIPALAFVLQKRLADRSRSDARYLASHDALTGLLNRHTFMERAEEIIERRGLSAVAYLDADEFKTVNDTYGHAAGDAYLKHIGNALEAACTSKDLVARFGGDEFVVALSEPAASDDVTERLEAIRTACAQDLHVNGLTIGSTVSIGAVHVHGELDLDRHLAHADTALYFAKSSGRNVVSTYTPDMSDMLHKRRELEALVRDAAAHDRFSIYYQPLVDAISHEIVGYEALLRLRDLDGKPVSPADFVPVAEDLGLIEEIGCWVLEQATRDIAAQPGDPFIAVNLSAAQFKSGRLVEHVKAVLSATGLPARRLELEITESLLIENHTSISVQFDALKDLGVSIALDDFGTGFSSMSYLWKFGFDRLKIDRSFAHGLEESPDRSHDLIDSIVILGERLGLQITAEGIETERQAKVLAALGAHVLQGFYFGVPQPFDTDTSDRERLVRHSA